MADVPELPEPPAEPFLFREWHAARLKFMKEHPATSAALALQAPPDLPPPGIAWPGADLYSASQMHAYGRQCYAAGRAAGLEEAAQACDEQQREPECPERATYCADAIRALKKEPK